METGSAESRYLKMESERYNYLERARDAARLTLPTLVVDEGHTASSDLPTPYQSVGARGVNNLASALLLSLLPPNAPFFRLILDQSVMMESEDADFKTRFEAAMSKIERYVMDEIETQAYRIQTFEALKHLIVAGNVLLHFPDEGGMRVIHLNRYTVKRTPMGKIRSIIVKETVMPDMLPPEAKGILSEKYKESSGDGIDLYTCIKSEGMSDEKSSGKKGSKKPEKFTVFQEIFKTVIPGSEGEFTDKNIPYIALRMNRAEGEDYGRGYVEQYIGDLKSLESLMMAVVEAAAAASKCLFMVAPNGVTRARVLAEAPNGGIVEGSANDVSVLQLNKGQDFSIASQTIQTISDRLSYAFLLTDNAIRQAERVTAAEIRLVTQSIERQLGGIYSVLSQEFQLPLVERLIEKMVTDKKLPKLDEKLVRPTIVTGVEALGRGNDLNKIDEFLLGVGQVLGPEVLGQYINFREYMDRRALALGIDTEGLIKSEEQIQGEMQQQQMNEQIQQMGPEGLAQMAGEAPEDAGPEETPQTEVL